MIVIRLTRVGKKNSPSYRVVVADKQRAVKRKFIEIIGNYNPTLIPKQIVIAKERALFWIERGAQPSDTVRNLMVNLDILPKKERVNKIYGKALSKKAIKAGPQEADKPKTNTTEEASIEEISGSETETPVEENIEETGTEEPMVEPETEKVEESEEPKENK